MVERKWVWVFFPRLYYLIYEVFAQLHFRVNYTVDTALIALFALIALIDCRPV